MSITRRLLLVPLLLLSAILSAEPIPSNSPSSLKPAIEDMADRGLLSPDQADDFLARLARPENQSGENFATLQRAALTANRLVSGHPILFVERAQYLFEHHNTETIYQTGEICTGKYRPGGPLKAIDLATGTVRVICDPGPDGHLRDPEVRPDGKRIVFSMRRNRGEDYHIYEIDADGSHLRQLTSATGVFDIDPVYLPDGDIVFTSSREPKYCGCNRHIMGNLFRMQADGANIHQLGKSTLFEGHSALTPDGRVLYDRWEYVDRNFGDAQGLWTMNPDGTNHAVFWGNNTSSPGAVLDARIIPGSGLCLCIFSSCHDNPWGALAIIDRNIGIDGRKPVVRTWPADAINLVGRGGFDTFKKRAAQIRGPMAAQRHHLPRLPPDHPGQATSHRHFPCRYLRQRNPPPCRGPRLLLAHAAGAPPPSRPPAPSPGITRMATAPSTSSMSASAPTWRTSPAMKSAPCAWSRPRKNAAGHAPAGAVRASRRPP